MSSRPAVSVVVPFTGSDAELRSLRERLEAIVRGAQDELIVSDNREHPLRTPAYARNRGAAQATGEWLVFLDADTTPEPRLLDAYFEPAPGGRTAMLAGGISDVEPARSTIVARYAVAREQLAHHKTLARAGGGYAQTANCAVLRSAFAAEGGFEETARAGEDADLCFRLRRAGWGLEERPGAAVAHEPRAALGAWLAQLVIHGSGARWLEGRWPEEFPRTSGWSFLRRLARHAADSAAALAQGDRERAAFSLLDLAGACAFQLGRAVPNRRRARSGLARTGESELRG